MRRREFICFLVFGLVCPCVALAQQSAKQTRIDWPSPFSSSPTAPVAKNLKAFRQSLHLGHVEDRNIAIEFRYADGNLDRPPSLAAELVEQKVDIMVTVAAISITDPVGRGLVESLARPGGNVTGLTLSVGLDIYSKSMELLTEAVPGLHVVGLLVNPANTLHAAVASQIEAAAQALTVRASLFQAHRPEEIATAFEAIAQTYYGAVLVAADPLFFSEAALIAKLALKYQLPSMHQLRETAEAGGLISYGPDTTDLNRRAAIYVEAVLTGAKPADLPIQQPTKFELVLNLKTARAPSLTISPTLLVRADEVIE